MITNELSESLNGRVLCGSADGEGVLIESLAVVERPWGKDTIKTQLEISGQATGYLIHETNPGGGVTELAEPVPCVDFLDLEAEDNQQFVTRVNRAFKIDPPLVDNEELPLRLSKGGDAHGQIVGKRVHFRWRHKKSDDKYGPTFNTYLQSMPKRVEVDQEAMKDILKRLELKKAAKAKAKAEQDDLLGGGGSGDLLAVGADEE